MCALKNLTRERWCPWRYVLREDGRLLRKQFLSGKKQHGSRGSNSRGDGGRRERKGFMDKKWWSELEQEE